MKILIHNKDEVQNKLEGICEDGIESLKIIADFDGTFTRENIEGTSADDTLEALTSTDKVSEECKQKIKEEQADTSNESSKPPEDSKEGRKKSNVEKWLGKISNENLKFGEIKQIVKDSSIRFREGFDTFLELKCELNIPLVIVSAGLGDVIKAALELQLEKQGMELKNLQPFKIISNLGEFKDGKLVSFPKEVVRPSNKEEIITTEKTKLKKGSNAST